MKLLTFKKREKTRRRKVKFHLQDGSVRNSMDHFPSETDITGENYFNYGLKVW